jgi:YVTN family beta-propeller protein
MKILSFPVLAACVIVLFAAGANAQKSNAGGYHLLNKYKLGGEGGWDALIVDEKGHRVFISRGTHVMVVDADSGKVVGDIPDTAGVHGIALDQDGGRGYTSNGRDNSVSVFDLKTLKVLSKISVGKNPDAIMYEPKSKRIITFNGGSNDATLIDPKTGVVAGTVALEGKPEFPASDEKGSVFINLEDKSEVVKFSPQSQKVEARWALAPCEEPTGIGLDRKHRRLFIGCGNKMMAVMDADSGKVLTTLPAGQGIDGADFDQGENMAFTSNGEGTLTVVREDTKDKFSVVENAPTQRGARTMALDTKTHRIYLPTAEFGPPPKPTKERPNPRPTMIPDTFTLLVFGK